VLAQIKAERAALDMPVAELADKAGVSQRAISRYLSGEREMSLRLVESFALALGIDLPTLIQRAAERQQ